MGVMVVINLNSSNNSNNSNSNSSLATIHPISPPSDHSVTCSVIDPTTYETLQTSSTLKGALRYFHSFQPSILLSAFAFSSLPSKGEGGYVFSTSKIVTLLTAFLCQLDACSFLYVVNFSPVNSLTKSLQSAFAFRKKGDDEEEGEVGEEEKREQIFYAGIMGYLEGVLGVARLKPFQIIDLHFCRAHGASIFSSSLTIGTPSSFSPPPFCAPPPPLLSSYVCPPAPAPAAPPQSTFSSPSLTPPHSHSPPPQYGMMPSSRSSSWVATASSSSSSSPPFNSHDSLSSSSSPVLSSSGSVVRKHNLISFFEEGKAEADIENSQEYPHPTLYFLNQILGKVVRFGFCNTKTKSKKQKNNHIIFLILSFSFSSPSPSSSPSFIPQQPKQTILCLLFSYSLVLLPLRTSHLSLLLLLFFFPFLLFLFFLPFPPPCLFYLFYWAQTPSLYPFHSCL